MRNSGLYASPVPPRRNPLMPLINSAFRPAWWLRGDHARRQARILQAPQEYPDIIWERVELDDGDFLDLAWSGPADGPIVLFLHGLQGSIESHYATGFMHRLNAAGFACA